MKYVTTSVLLIRVSLFSSGRLAEFGQRTQIPIYPPFLFMNILGLSNIRIMQGASYIYFHQLVISE